MPPARITFAIPYYCNLGYLEEAMNSIIQQTNTDWRAIVLDDRGGEDAEELVLSFHDPRIQYSRNDVNLGLAENWNKGLALADTEFVTLFHSDDVLMPNYIDDMLQLMDRHTVAVAGHCRTEIMDALGEKLWSFPDEFKKLIRPRSKSDICTEGDIGLTSLMNGSWIFCPSLCYRTSLIRDYKFDAQWKFIVDVDLMSKVLFDDGLLVGTTNVAYRYRRHRENQTAVLTRSLVRFREEILFLNMIHEKSVELGWTHCAKRSKRKIVTRVHLVHQAIQFLWARDFTTCIQAMAVAVRGKFPPDKFELSI